MRSSNVTNYNYQSRISQQQAYQSRKSTFAKARTKEGIASWGNVNVSSALLDKLRSQYGGTPSLTERVGGKAGQTAADAYGRAWGLTEDTEEKPVPEKSAEEIRSMTYDEYKDYAKERMESLQNAYDKLKTQNALQRYALTGGYGSAYLGNTFLGAASGNPYVSALSGVGGFGTGLGSSLSAKTAAALYSSGLFGNGYV